MSTVDASKIMAFTATEYSALYGLIGRCLVLELDVPTVELLRSDDVLSVLSKLEPGIRAYLERSWSAELIDEAAADYCALFVLPKGVTLTASYWIEGSTDDIGHQMVAGVQQVLDNFGLSVERLEMGNVPLDNVGLLVLLAAQLFGGDVSAGSGYGLEFVESFITPWVARFCDAVPAKSDNPVYRALAQLFSEITLTSVPGTPVPGTPVPGTPVPGTFNAS